MRLWNIEPCPTVGSVSSPPRMWGLDSPVRVVALDHGQSFVQRLTVTLRRPPSPHEVLDAKVALLDQLAPVADGVVLDPGGLLEQATRRGLLPGDCFVVAGLPDMEARNATQSIPEVRRAVGHVSDFGCHGVKLCLIVNPGDALDDAVRLASEFSGACHRCGLAAVVEAVTPQQVRARHGVGPVGWRDTVDLARLFSVTGADLLKLGFPRGAHVHAHREQVAACARVTEAAGGTPWALLSAGVSFEEFDRQLAIACLGGAAGYIAGTAIWQEALDLQGDRRREFIANTSVSRALRLANLVTTVAASGRDVTHAQRVATVVEQ